MPIYRTFRYMIPKFPLRDLFWLVIVITLGLGWWAHVRQVKGIQFELEQKEMNHELEEAQNVAECTDRMEIVLIEVSNQSFRRFGPFITTDQALMSEIRRCLHRPDDLDRNLFRRNRPNSRRYLEITMVSTVAKREYRLRISGDSIALGDQARYRVIREGCRIWREASRVAHAEHHKESIRWNNDSLKAPSSN